MSTETPECLDQYQGKCAGEIEYRYPLSPTGVWFPRCDKHWEARLKTQERITRQYGHPESSVPPAGFDPSYAGERWDEDY